MLVIREAKKPYKVWHVNEPVPDFYGPVVDFQADGHELELILLAMESGYDYKGNLIPRKEK